MEISILVLLERKKKSMFFIWDTHTHICIYISHGSLLMAIFIINTCHLYSGVTVVSWEKYLILAVNLWGCSALLQIKHHLTKHLLRDHLTPISKIIQIRRTRLNGEEHTHKQHFTMDPYTWTFQGWPTSKNFHKLSVCEHWILSRGLANNDDQ